MNISYTRPRLILFYLFYEQQLQFTPRLLSSYLIYELQLHPGYYHRVIRSLSGYVNNYEHLSPSLLTYSYFSATCYYRVVHGSLLGG